jgi:hypothetical protein
MNVIKFAIIALTLLLLFTISSLAQTHSAQVYYRSGGQAIPIEDANVTFIFGSGTGSGTFQTDDHGNCATTHICTADSCSLRVSVSVAGFDPVNQPSGEYFVLCNQQRYFLFEMELSDGALRFKKETIILCKGLDKYFINIR